MVTIVSEIIFENNPDKVCYSGQLLKGLAKIRFPVHTHVEAIYIKFVGEGFYSWVDDISDHQRTGSWQYFTDRKYLAPRSNGYFDASAGNHKYPFQVQLLSNLPTSYEGTYGHVRYMMELVIVSPGQRYNKDPVIYETFTVIRPLNLNDNFAFVMPMNVSKAARFTFGFTRLCVLFSLKSGDLHIFGRLPVSGYCCGQIINLKLDVINQSGQGVLIILVDFVKVVTYNARDGSKKMETITLTKRKIRGFRGSETGIQSKVINITVPCVPPTSFQSTSDVCVFKYMLKVTAVTGLWFYKDPILEIPVIIGTYPVTNEMYQTASRQLTQLLACGNTEAVFPSAPAEPVLPSAPALEIDDHLNDLPPYPDIDPPTYEEALHSEPWIVRNENNPKYPVYSKATVYSTRDLN